MPVCLSGRRNSQIHRQRLYDEAKEIARKYQDCFGKDNFFLELQDHGIDDRSL